MPSFSLITTSINRVDDLNALYESVVLQNRSDIECILVDQNPDDRLVPIVERWSEKLFIKHVRSPKGAARGRNTGLDHATGEFIAFPDDDCMYTPGLLDNVQRWFNEHKDYSIFTTGANDIHGVPSGNRWFVDACDITAFSAWRTTFASTIFMRNDKFMQGVRIDEKIGPGSGTGLMACEETDYILEVLRRGAKGYFTKQYWIIHPKRDMLSHSVDPVRAHGYGQGMGYVLRRRSQFLLWLGFMGYDFARAALSTLRADMGSARLCVAHGSGVFTGYSSFAKFAALGK